MKHNHIFLLAAILCMSAACDKNGPAQGAPVAPDRLSITVSDAGYVPESGNAPSVRVIDEGYLTEFTAGDACGLFIVRNGTVVEANARLSAADDGKGGIVWMSEEELSHAEGDVYYLYYPWKETPDDVPVIGDVFADVSSTAFFSDMTAAWKPAADQSDHAAYTASDLMTAKAYAVVSQDGTAATLSFGMTHRMALAIVKLPVPSVTGPDGEPSVWFDKFSVPYIYPEGCYRYLINPLTGGKIVGYYEDDGQHEFEIKVAANSLAGGRYRIYDVDGE